jgi:methyl coenzyme M reductase beta subunit
MKRYISLNIDFKDGDIELIEKVDQMLKKYNYQDKVIWGSFIKETTLKCQIVNQKVSRFQSREEFFRVLILYYLGILPF